MAVFARYSAGPVRKPGGPGRALSGLSDPLDLFKPAARCATGWISEEFWGRHANLFGDGLRSYPPCFRFGSKSGLAMEAPVRSTSENAAEFAWRHDDVFGRIAGRYDLLCDVFSFGIHRLWKRRVAQRIASEDWDTLVDGATGTGDIILRLLAHEITAGRTVVASDISPKMLAVAQARLSPRSEVELRQLDAENMASVASDSVDAYSISLGLKICNRRLAINEAFRILRPGGRIIVLEASNIPWKPLHLAYLAYMSVCMPLLGWLATGGDASAYRYLLHGIREFPSAEALAAEFRGHGFEDVSFERLSLGIVAIHTARKPNGASAS